MSATFLASKCCCNRCSNCITLFAPEAGGSALRKKSIYRGTPDSQYVFQDFRTIAEHWGAFVPPDLDPSPVVGTGNPAYSEEYDTYFNAQTCSKLLISPFITGALDDQTGSFVAEYTLKTTYSGLKPYTGCLCFGQENRPFAVDYNSQDGTLLNTFPYWLGPLITNTDCPAASGTGASQITPDLPENCPYGPLDGTGRCCRVGGYELDGSSTSPRPQWDWLQSRDWWNYDPTETPGPPGPLTFANARLILLVSYLSISMWRNYGGMPEVHTWVEMQPAGYSGARINGAFLSYEP